jgi:hypothetical protein
MIFRPWSNWARAEPTVLQLLWTNRDPDGGLVLVEGEAIDGRPEVASPREPFLRQICDECVSARVGLGIRGLGPVPSHRMYLSMSFRKSSPTHNH